MKQRTVLSIVVIVILSILLTACAPAASQAPTSMDYGGAAPAAEPPAQPLPQGQESGKNLVANSPGSSSGDAIQRLVIRNANLGIVVKDPGASMDAIAKMAEGMGGYVVNSNLFKATSSQGVEVPQAEITVRVPADKLTQALDQIKAMVENKDTDVLSENVTGQDVTKEYTDQKSRLTNLENTEKQLQKFLDETTKTEDALAVYNQLVSIREQIEVTKGSIQYYEESAALSAIVVRLQSQEAVQPVSIGGWRPIGVARDALQALINVLQFMVNALIVFVILLLPIGLILVAVFFLLRFIFLRIVKSRPRKQTPPTPPAPPQAPTNS